MARGSEQLTWKQLGGKHPCSACGRTLRVDEVREHRTVYPGGKLEVFCAACFEARVTR